MEKAYTLSQIDRMRAALRSIIQQPPQSWVSSMNGGYSSETPESQSARANWHRRVEDELRTYMTGSIEPEELEAKAAALHVGRAIVSGFGERQEFSGLRGVVVGNARGPA